MEPIALKSIQDLSDAEITGAIRAFADARDRHAKEGKTGMASFFSELAQAFRAEEIYRKHFEKHVRRETSGIVSWSWGDSPDN